MDNRPPGSWILRPATPAESQPAPISVSTPLTGGEGKLIGRVIVEEFENGDPQQSDGINYKISFPAGTTPDEIRKYGRDLVKKLSARLDRR